MVYRIAAHFKESHVTFFENIQSRRCFDETAYVVPGIAAVWKEAISAFKGTGTRAVYLRLRILYKLNAGMKCCCVSKYMKTLYVGDSREIGSN